MTEEAKTPVLLDDVVVMGRIKRLMVQLNPKDYDIVSRWICDKYRAPRATPPPAPTPDL